MTKFDMGNDTLPTLIKRTQGAHQDLGALVHQLVAAAQPLEGKFNGAGRAAFDAFKSHADQISADLNLGVASINQGQHGMHTAYVEGDQQMSDNSRHSEGDANFETATFRTGTAAN
jgi:uncharacterized protein YukE